jgi:hypothetical protein
MNTVIVVSDMSNQEFLETYARAGCVGLAGGSMLIDKAIGRAQRHLDDEHRWSKWSHAFFFQGVRPDGHAWVIESDLQINRKHIRLGAQENRISKFYDEGFYSRLAVLDFGVDEATRAKLVGEGLNLVADRFRYSVRELIGTLVALRHPELRVRPNVMSRSSCFYCSAFVEHLFRQAGMTLVGGLDEKNTTPEDIFRSWRPHTTYVLERPKAARTGKIARVAKVVGKVRSRLKRSKGAGGKTTPTA